MLHLLFFWNLCVLGLMHNLYSYHKLPEQISSLLSPLRILSFLHHYPLLNLQQAFLMLLFYLILFTQFFIFLSPTFLTFFLIALYFLFVFIFLSISFLFFFLDISRTLSFFIYFFFLIFILVTIYQCFYWTLLRTWCLDYYFEYHLYFLVFQSFLIVQDPRNLANLNLNHL